MSIYHTPICVCSMGGHVFYRSPNNLNLSSSYLSTLRSVLRSGHFSSRFIADTLICRWMRWSLPGVCRLLLFKRQPRSLPWETDQWYLSVTEWISVLGEKLHASYFACFLCYEIQRNVPEETKRVQCWSPRLVEPVDHNGWSGNTDPSVHGPHHRAWFVEVVSGPP